MNWWEMLSQIARTLLLMSITGSVITLLLFGLKPLLKKRLPKNLQHAFWTVALAAFLIPFSAFVSLPFSTPMAPLQQVLREHVKTSAEWKDKLAEEEYGVQYQALDSEKQIEISYEKIGIVNGHMGDYALVSLFTMGGVQILILLTQYGIFANKLRRRREPAKAQEADLLRTLCQKRGCPCVYRTELAKTPMLVGVFHPVIYLPSREYSQQQLENIFLHELTHWKRKDVLIKWVTSLCTAVHWFNPLAYLLRREIGRICELACDEAVTGQLDCQGKQSYGDTLIEMAADEHCRKTIASTTMCEEKRTLKERLGEIMKSPKYTGMAILLSGLFLLTVIGITVFIGSGTKDDSTGSRVGIAPYTLSENESRLLQSFRLDDNSQIISYHAPTAATSLEINVYRLGDAGWESIGGGGISIGPERQPTDRLSGLFTMILNEDYSMDFNVISDDGGTFSFTSDAISPEREIMATAKGFLTEFQEIELNKEIPVAIAVYDDGNTMRSYSLQDFYNPEFEGMELVQAVTLTFTDKA